MRYTRWFLLVTAVFFISCKSAKDAITPEQMASFKQTISKKEIDIEFTWAQPSGLLNNVRGIENLLPIGSSVNNINLIGNPNYLRIIKDSIAMDLPYFGQQQLANNNTYGSTETGMIFKGFPEKFNQIFNKKKNRYMFKYSLNTESEYLKMTLYLYPNNIATLSVNSSHRTIINYNGNWKVLTAKEE